MKEDRQVVETFASWDAESPVGKMIEIYADIIRALQVKVTCLESELWQVKGPVLRRKADQTDEETQRGSLEVLKTMRKPEIMAAYLAYIARGTMDKAAAHLKVSKSTVQRRLKKAERLLNVEIIRGRGGAAHAGDTYRQGGKKRNINHRAT